MNSKKIILIILVIYFLITASRIINDYAVDFVENQKDRENGLMIGAKPFAITKNPETTVLLVHGTSSSPRDYKELSEFLASKNISSKAMLLPGHGTHPKDLADKKYEEWMEAIKNELNNIDSKNKFLLGYSLGGTLAINIGEDEDLSGIILINTPISFQSRFIPFVPILKLVQKYHVKKPEDIILISNKNRIAYDSIPLDAITEISRGIKQLELEKVEEPILIIQTMNDTLVNPESANLIFNKISSNKKRLLWLEGSPHGNLFKEEQKIAFEEVYRFIEKNSKP